MEGEAIRWQSPVDGVELFARSFGGPTPGGACVVCIHGLTQNSRVFGGLVGHLTALEGVAKVLAVDVRGRGQSGRGEAKNYHLAVYASDVRALLVKLGLEGAHFIGTSMGGLITEALALEHPQMIRSAVLNDIGPEFDAKGITRIMSYAGKAKKSIFESREEAAEYLRSILSIPLPNFNDWDQLVDYLFDKVDQGFQLAYDPAITSQQDPYNARLWDLYNALVNTGKPVLLLRGALSDLLSEDTTKKMVAVRPESVSLVQVPGVGHAPLLVEPEALESILNHLKQSIA